MADWLNEREEVRAQARREQNPWMRGLAAREWTEAERRRRRLLDALFRAAERNGIQIKQPDRFTVYFEASKERIDFKLKEKQKQVRVPKDADEIKRLLPGEKPWRHQLQPAGILSYSIETHIPALPRRVWTETAEQPLEGDLADILATLLLAGPILVQQRCEREEAERRQREEEHQRYKAAELKRLDDNRWRRFTELAARWWQADEVRRFLVTLEERASVEKLSTGQSILDHLAWGRARLAAYDPLAEGPAGVFEDVLKVTIGTYRE